MLEVLGARRRQRPRLVDMSSRPPTVEWLVNGLKVWTASPSFTALRPVDPHRQPDSAHGGITAFFVECRFAGMSPRPIEAQPAGSVSRGLLRRHVHPRRSPTRRVGQGWQVAVDVLPTTLRPPSRITAPTSTTRCDRLVASTVVTDHFR